MARSGQALVEYVLIVALVAVALLASLILFREAVAARLDDLSVKVECATPANGGAPPGHGGQPPGQCRKASQ